MRLERRPIETYIPWKITTQMMFSANNLLYSTNRSTTFPDRYKTQLWAKQHSEEKVGVGNHGHDIVRRAGSGTMARTGDGKREPHREHTGCRFRTRASHSYLPGVSTLNMRNTCHITGDPRDPKCLVMWFPTKMVEGVLSMLSSPC